MAGFRAQLLMNNKNGQIQGVASHEQQNGQFQGIPSNQQ